MQPTSLAQHSRLKTKIYFTKKQQKSHADVLIFRQKHQLDEIISLKEQVSEIAHIKSEFLALKTELVEVKEQNKRYEKKLSELITYSIFYTKNPEAQEVICFIVRREAEKVTDPGSPTGSTSATHTPTPSLPTPQIQVTSSPHIHQSPHHRSPIITSPPRHTFSTSQQPTQITIAIMMGCTSNQDLIMISHHNISDYHIHKTELQAFLEDHSPAVVTLDETFTEKGYKYNMPHYTAVTRNREHGKGGGIAILLRHDLAYTEIDDIQLTSTMDNEQLTAAIRIDSNREL